jgi:diguanylate cyclase (GGDEF)-like protein
MTDDQIELAILRRYIDQHKAGELADPQRQRKCARELDMRDVISGITSQTGSELEYTARFWHERLAPRHRNSKGPLRPCSESPINSTEHRYHARAFTKLGAAPAWDRVRELEARLPAGSRAGRELEQKFGILYSAAQEQRDFDTWVQEAEGIGISGYTIAVIFLDVDDFKEFNTKFTEAVVDRTLLPDLQRLVGDICFQRGAAYRHGGEELLALLPNCGLEEAAGFAEKLRSHIAAHEFAVDGRAVRLTVSIGVAAWPTHGDSLEAVIERANREERRAKEGGKDSVRTASA